MLIAGLSLLCFRLAVPESQVKRGEDTTRVPNVDVAKQVSLPKGVRVTKMKIAFDRSAESENLTKTPTLWIVDAAKSERFRLALANSSRLANSVSPGGEMEPGDMITFYRSDGTVMLVRVIPSRFSISWGSAVEQEFAIYWSRAFHKNYAKKKEED
jgi:hypothetical protein